MAVTLFTYIYIYIYVFWHVTQCSDVNRRFGGKLVKVYHAIYHILEDSNFHKHSGMQTAQAARE